MENIHLNNGELFISKMETIHINTENYLSSQWNLKIFMMEISYLDSEKFLS
jgi:hypothetical protein